MFENDFEGPNLTEDQSLNREELLHLAIQTAKENPQGARVMFQQVLAQDPRNERALLWMASLTKQKEERRQYLQRALRVNPRSSHARKELQRLDHMDKARSNRTLIYGGLVIAGVILLIVLAVLLAIAL